MIITQNYSWQTPATGQSCYAEAFGALVNSIDAAIGAIRGPNTTLVVSAIANTSFGVIAGSAGPYTTQGWTVISYAPYGRLVGSFGMSRNGAVFLRTNFQFCCYSIAVTYGSRSPQGMYTYHWFRAIANPGSINLTTDSAWHVIKVAPSQSCAGEFVHIASLGAGSYSLSLETRLLVVGNSGPTNLFACEPLDHAFLWATEARFG